MTRDLSPQQAAKLLVGINWQIIHRCFDSGDLPGYRLPGSKHRRIKREDLLAWAKRHGVPVRKDGGSEQ